VAGLLRDAAGEGRLTAEELGDRLGLAYAARTSGQLQALTGDLPASTPSSTPSVGRPLRTARFVIAVMSGAKRRGRWRLEGQCFAMAVMGGCSLDLRQAEIAGSRVTINALSVMGGIEIIVPEGVQVELSGLAVMGGKRAHLADVPIRPGAPLIQVHALAVMGGVAVKSAPGPDEYDRPR
jgi:hypothetical protein